MITITHPSSTSGTVVNSGLTFVDGKAEVATFDDPAAVAVLEAHGYTFEGEPEKSAQDIVGKKLESLSRAEIDAIAAEYDIDVSSAKNKAEAIALIDASGKIPVLGADGVAPADADPAGAAGDADATPAADGDQSGAPAS